MIHTSLPFKDTSSFEKSHSNALSCESESPATSLSSTSIPAQSLTPSPSKIESTNDTFSPFNEGSESNSNFVAALKEWAIVCKAAEDGKQVLLFRKGGIMEYRNGFELKHKNFFLFPTFEHQSMESIRNEYQAELENLEKQHIRNDIPKDSKLLDQYNSDTIQNITNINLFVEITYFNEINDINKLEKLEKFHIWNIDYVKMRFNYNPKKPLYLMLLRTYKLNDVIKIHNKHEWAGCKSWIQIDLGDRSLENYFTNSLSHNFEYLKSISKPCIDNETFNNITEEVRSII
ncbi:MAG: DUF1802 family protein [Nitrosopumilus sp.]|nr:DUF1802 family protein [Nitrosopumilus sp.]